MNAMRDLFPRAVTAHHATRLPRSADAVWAEIGDFGEAILSRGMVERIETEGEGIGMCRLLHLGGGACVRETLVERSEEERYYIYRVADAGPVGVAHQIGMGQVIPAGPDQCILSWMTAGNPVDGASEALQAMLDAIVQGACDNARRHFS
ncbi:SRPBCC family protein [Sphingobium sp. EM0848]|uniref:SRPBCC family protein n=1 Tax=Sphingobium sp. EM0848 TaxID=2743473 RepID=UPI00159C0EC1|nr:SRPBCC family protein [Sphingobium sp. EM0848]